MTDQPKRSTWRTITICLVVLAVFYPVSAGPSAWAIGKLEPDGPGFATTVFSVLYAPLMMSAVWTGTEQYFLDYLNWFAFRA